MAGSVCYLSSGLRLSAGPTNWQRQSNQAKLILPQDPGDLSQISSSWCCCRHRPILSLSLSLSLSFCLFFLVPPLLSSWLTAYFLLALPLPMFCLACQSRARAVIAQKAESSVNRRSQKMTRRSLDKCHLIHAKKASFYAAVRLLMYFF